MDRKQFARQFPDEASARAFFERIIWKDGRVCPHCGSVDRSWKIDSEKVSKGTYQCGERGCSLLFTVTTKTPLHSTKLPLIKWLEAMWFVMEMPKGISSVTLAKVIGVTQKTAWKMGHAIRLLMEQHGARKLDGVVEVDEKYLGGKPRKKHGVKHKRGMGTAKQGILVAVERGGGEVRAALIPSSSSLSIFTPLQHMVAKSAHLMTDENTAYVSHYASHKAVKHKGARRRGRCPQQHRRELQRHAGTGEDRRVPLDVQGSHAALRCGGRLSLEHARRGPAGSNQGGQEPDEVHPRRLRGSRRCAAGGVARQAAHVDYGRRDRLTNVNLDGEKCQVPLSSR